MSEAIIPLLLWRNIVYTDFTDVSKHVLLNTFYLF